MNPPSKTVKVLAAAALLACAVATTASAEAPKSHPEGWQTWTWDGNCYALNYAKGPGHLGVQNGDTYIAIKHLPRERNYDNVSVVSGFGDVTGISATIEVAGEEFPLLVYGNSGFVRSGDPERRLMDLLEKSSDATVTWYRKDGLAVQTYDVKGFALAKKTIDVACPHVAPPAPVVAQAEPDKSDQTGSVQAPAAAAEAPKAKPAPAHASRGHGKRHR